MSAIDPSAAALPVTAAPLTDPSRAPAWVRHGGTKAQQAYATGVAFEQVLVNQLTQQLTASAGSDSSSGDASSSSAGGSSGDSSATGLMGSDPASSMYAQMLPQVLTSSITAGGGTGLAGQIAAAIDPTAAAKR